MRDVDYIYFRDLIKNSIARTDEIQDIPSSTKKKIHIVGASVDIIDKTLESLNPEDINILYTALKSIDDKTILQVFNTEHQKLVSKQQRKINEQVRYCDKELHGSKLPYQSGGLNEVSFSSLNTAFKEFVRKALSSLTSKKVINDKILRRKKASMIAKYKNISAEAHRMLGNRINFDRKDLKTIEKMDILITLIDQLELLEDYLDETIYLFKSSSLKNNFPKSLDLLTKRHDRIKRTLEGKKEIIYNLDVKHLERKISDGKNKDKKNEGIRKYSDFYSHLLELKEKSVDNRDEIRAIENTLYNIVREYNLSDSDIRDAIFDGEVLYSDRKNLDYSDVTLEDDRVSIQNRREEAIKNQIREEIKKSIDMNEFIYFEGSTPRIDYDALDRKIERKVEEKLCGISTDDIEEYIKVK